MAGMDGREPSGAQHTDSPAALSCHVPSFWDLGEPLELPDPQAQIVRNLSELFWQIEPIGQSRHGLCRFAWTIEEAWLRVWFAAHMISRGFHVSVDAAGNQWAWIGGTPSPSNPALSVGSHLDSVPDAGAFDGPLGVLSAMVAYDDLTARGWQTQSPLAIVHFHDEEGARFAIACLGSRVLTGAVAREQALDLTDADGVSLAQAMSHFPDLIDQVCEQAPESRALALFSPTIIAQAAQASQAPPLESFGAQPHLLANIASHVELHVEQGNAQSKRGIAVAVAEGIWPHGRWRLEFEGIANHAGTTPLEDREDALLAFAQFTVAVREEALEIDARATVGKVQVIANGVNVIASHVSAWLDARADSQDKLRVLIDHLTSRFPDVRITLVSWTDHTHFCPQLRTTLVDSVARVQTPSVAGRDTSDLVIGTAAGHDAGILQDAGVPSGMLFVRNETGASHTPEEYASASDCAAGVMAYARVIEDVGTAIARGFRPAAQRVLRR